MDLSIILTSFQRANLLKWGLTSIARQNITCEYEILVLNDGMEDDTKVVCDSFPNLPIRYIFTGHRNTPSMQWRCAGFTVNIGVKLAKGRNIIIGCAEMFLLDDLVQKMVEELDKGPKRIVTTDGKDDTSRVFLDNIEEAERTQNFGLYYHKAVVELCVRYPFFMGLNRQWVLDIGGYNEEMTGYGYDDTEFARRLDQTGGTKVELSERVVHLYHRRNDDRPGIPSIHPPLFFNKKVYDETNGAQVVNVGKEWGVMGADHSHNV